jgi:hypothetical protein
MDMYEILPYSPELDQRFDHFVEKESVNGTFLQTRRFLNYHPADRFVDASFALQKSGTIVAYFPGVVKDGSFVSHAGSTFGGPIIAKPYYTGARLFEILQEADQYLTANFKHVTLKITPPLFAEESPDLLEYVLEHLGYTRHTELSSQTPLSKDIDPIENCNRNQRRLWTYAQKFIDALPESEKWEYRAIESDQDIATFHKFLVISKEKHNTKPVHSAEELIDLKKRIPQNLRFRGLFFKGRYVCGMMQFIFDRTRVLHDQYISPDESFSEFHHTTPMNLFALREAAAEGFTHFSWGISTEDHGNVLNEDLLHYKESFGAIACVNSIYEK